MERKEAKYERRIFEWTSSSLKKKKQKGETENVKRMTTEVGSNDDGNDDGDGELPWKAVKEQCVVYVLPESSGTLSERGGEARKKKKRERDFSCSPAKSFPSFPQLIHDYMYNTGYTLDPIFRLLLFLPSLLLDSLLKTSSIVTIKEGPTSCSNILVQKVILCAWRK